MIKIEQKKWERFKLTVFLCLGVAFGAGALLGFSLRGILGCC